MLGVAVEDPQLACFLWKLLKFATGFREEVPPEKFEKPSDSWGETKNYYLRKLIRLRGKRRFVYM